jgi:diguanylate cyclase (GGDEF)-like protein
VSDGEIEKSERAPGLPRRAQVFLLGTALAALAVTAVDVAHSRDSYDWLAFGVLVAAASLVQLFAFHTIRNQVFHTTPLFFVAGAMLLSPQLLVLLPLISHIPDWVRKRYAWYIQTFNILNFTLAVMCAWGVARLVHGMGAAHGSWAAAAAAAAATFVVVNNFGFAVILYLARGHRPREILSAPAVAADASLACLGVAFASFWDGNAYLLPFALGPIFLLHFALHLPQLREEARADAKTGLANARHLGEALTEELTRARRFSRPLSVLVVALDLLQSVNSTYGYLAGDAVLVGVADLIRKHLRQYDFAARSSGAEFAIVLPETGLPDAEEIAERIREAVADTPIWAESARQHVSVTLSIGVAAFPTHGTDPDDLLRHGRGTAERARLQGGNAVLRASLRPVLTPVASEPIIAAAVVEDERRELPPAEEVLVRAGTGRSTATKLLVGTVAAAGIVAGALAAAFGSGGDIGGLVATAGLVAGGQLLALELDHGASSAGAVAAIAGAAIFGGRGTLLLAAAMVAVDTARRRWPPRQALLSLGVRSLALLAAAGIFALAHRDGLVQLLTIVAGPVAGVTSFALASALLSLALVVDGRESWWRAWRGRFGWLVPHYIVYGFIAGVAAVAYREAGIYALAAFAVALLAIRGTQHAVVKQARKNAQTLRHATEMIQTQNISLERAHRLLKQQSTSAMESLSGIVDMRDAYTAGHSRRVRDLALAIGRELGLSVDALDVLGRAALFHDLGKLAVPDAILLKRGPLSPAEWAAMRRHPDEGARVIERLAPLAMAAPAVRYHHERIDGRGYPSGLAGDEIPLAARIIFVADAYDSMRTNRIYRPARSSAEALHELRANAGTQFCARCVEALAGVLAGGTFAGEDLGHAGRPAADEPA